MKQTIAIVAVALSLMSSQAFADEHRGGDAALGALSGAVVLGPIGAVAGAVVGYTAGPSIAHGLGFRHTRSAARRARPTHHPEVAAAPRPATNAAAPAPAPVPRTAETTTMPPVQGLE
jgi:hypothetical protein